MLAAPMPNGHLTTLPAAPCILYIGQAFRYSPENAFYIFNQKYISLYFFRLAAQSQFIPLQNVVYFITLPFFWLVKYSEFP